jgi:YVTN family beta-propeller protein
MNHIRLSIFLALTALIVGCGDGGGDSTPAPDTGRSDTAADTTPDTADTGGGDTGTDVPDPDVTPDADPDLPDTTPDEDTSVPSERRVDLPLGETLFLDGDEYLSFWGVLETNPLLTAVPDGSEATVQERRLTPDVEGVYVLEHSEVTVRLHVRSDLLNEDTFLNFNYTPVTALAAESDDSLWVVSPPSNAVQRVEMTPDGPVAQELVPTGSWPVSVAIWGDYVLVAQSGRDSLGFIDRTTHKLVDAIRVGNEPADIIVDGDVAYISLSGEDRVARIDLTQRRVTGTLDVSRDPRAMAFDPTHKRLFVASTLSSNSTPQGPLQEVPIPLEDQQDIAVIDTETFEFVAWTAPAGTIIRGLWLDPNDPTVLVVARTHANNFRARIDADSTPHTHGLTLIDIDPESEGLYNHVNAGQLGAGQIQLDTQESSTGPAASPFTMLPTPDGEKLLVTLSASQSILVLDRATFAEIERLPTGHDPRGLVVAQGRVWTLAFLDNQVTSFALPTEPGVAALTVASVTVGNDPTPTEVKQGQRIFNDAAFSRHSDFSCNSCHIDGITDGLVWSILLDGNVNTLAFRNVGGTGPFLWGGQLPTLFDFSREVLRLVGATATGEQMELLTTYMQSVTAPPNPYALPGGRFTEQALSGRDIFFASAAARGGAGCGECHSGPLFTNRQLVDGKTPNTRTDVPSLLGVYDTGPWGREAQWTTLGDMVDYAVVFTGGTLEPTERDALLAYVRQLPGDLLYLNSSSPLNGGKNVWVETHLEMVFSAVLAQGADEHFTAEVRNGENWVEYQGAWLVEGRRVTFEPLVPLAEGAEYRFVVAPGLSGVLGESTKEELLVEFETGEGAEVDMSGGWRLRVTAPLDGSVRGAFLQAAGGRVTGAILESDGVIDFDHVEGFVVGTTLILEPFLVESEFGQVRIDSAVIELYDDDEDGLADRGEGVAHTIVDLTVLLERTSYPED